MYKTEKPNQTLTSTNPTPISENAHEKKDIKPLLEANSRINIFLEKYPNTDYAIDLKFKQNLIRNQLAAK